MEPWQIVTRSMAPVPLIATDASTLDECPQCGSTVPEHRVLITYERGDQVAAYATCPACRGPVRPRD